MDAAYFLPKFMLKRLILKCLWRSLTMNWETENPGSWAAHMKFILKHAEDFFYYVSVFVILFISDIFL